MFIYIYIFVQIALNEIPQLLKMLMLLFIYVSSLAYYDSPAIVRTRSCTPMTPEMSKILPYVTDKTISKHLGSYGGYMDLGHANSYFNPAT